MPKIDFTAYETFESLITKDFGCLSLRFLKIEKDTIAGIAFQKIQTSLRESNCALMWLTQPDKSYVCLWVPKQS